MTQNLFTKLFLNGSFNSLKNLYISSLVDLLRIRAEIMEKIGVEML